MRRGMSIMSIAINNVHRSIILQQNLNNSRLHYIPGDIVQSAKNIVGFRFEIAGDLDKNKVGLADL